MDRSSYIERAFTVVLFSFRYKLRGLESLGFAFIQSDLCFVMCLDFNTSKRALFADCVFTFSSSFSFIH